jgi:hypothetical protein
MHSPTHVTSDQVHVFLNLGSNIKTNMLWPYFLSNPCKKKKDFKYKYFQNMVFYTNYRILQLYIKNIHLQIAQTIKNNLICKFTTNSW